MARRDKNFTPFERTRGGASVLQAAAIQVRADFQRDRLNQKHQEGQLSDKELIQGLTGLAKDYRRGTVLRRDIRSERTGAAQQVATTIIGQREENQVEFLDQAQGRWANAQNMFAQGQMGQAQFDNERKLYDSALTGRSEIPGQKKVVRQVLSGKAFDRYKSGRVRSIMREKQIKALLKQEGQEVNKSTVREFAGSEGTIPFMRSQIEADKAPARNLESERTALSELTKELGRLPTQEEINTRVYG